VQDNGLIRLQVAPEVSQLDAANSVRINGINVPALITRKADTTVELKNGDSLAMGGLFQHNYDNTLRQFPVLGDLPVIGTLFRSARWKRAETELVIIVTPRLVQPQDFAAAQALKSLGGPEPRAGDLLLKGEALDKPTTRDLGAKKP
jgi:pilus assembly protein CpaC